MLNRYGVTNKGQLAVRKSPDASSDKNLITRLNKGDTVYLLMAAGVLLVFLGLVDLYRGRKCYEEED